MAVVSIVSYIHDLKDAGFTDQQSEVQARQLEEIIAEVKGELANKKDLELTKKDIELSIETVKKELQLSIETVKKDLQLSIETVKGALELSIEKLRYETLRFVVWTGIGVVAALGGMLAKGFHWV